MVDDIQGAFDELRPLRSIVVNCLHETPDGAAKIAEYFFNHFETIEGIFQMCLILDENPDQAHDCINQLAMAAQPSNETMRLIRKIRAAFAKARLAPSVYQQADLIIIRDALNSGQGTYLGGEYIRCIDKGLRDNALSTVTRLLGA